MAISIVLTVRLWLFAVALTYVSVLYGNLGKADEVPQDHDPAQIVAKALLCFNEKYVYSSCEESQRLSESGKLNVPPQKTDEYCSGPCLTETNLVLNCIENILDNFKFYNKATIQDVRDTVKAACGNGPERGNFDVAEHIKAETSNAHKAVNQILYGLGLMIVGHGLLP
ncbi:uncharacterized protein LOC126715402 [Quercus robur]|uniref:uncharacterized protein LOC126715402 n=1 Tax=Quercus robur TaxID=38942 RepID=UPI00216262E7|nr:uncharacterized protein LOC126715402 [Quercus robur]